MNCTLTTILFVSFIFFSTGSVVQGQTGPNTRTRFESQNFEDFVYGQVQTVVYEVSLSKWGQPIVPRRFQHSFTFDRQGTLIGSKSSYPYLGCGLQVPTSKKERYNNKNQLMEIQEILGNGDLLTRTDLKYDMNGTITLKEVKWSDGRILRQQKYDAAGLLIEDNYYLNSAASPIQHLYTRNPRGEIVEECTIDAGELLEKAELSYSYDNKGNWITCEKIVTQYLANRYISGRRDSIYRTITYFED